MDQISLIQELAATSLLCAKRGMWGGQHRRWQKMANIPVVSASIHLDA